MLQEKVLEPDALVLLKEIQNLKEFSDFRLVGGTALALQYGHRKSIDLDFFGKRKFDSINFEVALSGFTSIRIVNNTAYIKQYFINETKVDFVQYPYNWIDDAIIEDGAILATSKDIAAMKLSAITNRGSKKDFIDLFQLLKIYSLKEMVNFYSQKYPDGSEFLVLKSLNYFHDAEKDEMPTMFENTTWEEVKEKISEEHGKYVRG